MKFVEKKCPNCGAGLKFDDNATSVMCEYCNQTFYIQKDEKKYARVDEAHVADAFKFVDEVGKPIVKAFATAHIVMSIVPVIIFFIVFAIIGFTIFTGVSSQMEDDDEFGFGMFGDLVDESKYVTKLSEIDAIALDTFYEEAKSDLHHMDNKDYKVGEWTPVGSYLLVSKDKKSNKLYTVMQHTYTKKSNGKTVTLYAAMLFEDLKLNESGVVTHDYMGSTISQDVELDGDTHNWAEGYDSVEKLYNREIRSQVGDYKVTATDGLYMES